MAEKHGKAWIHVDAITISTDSAVQLVRAWLNGSDVKVLNVAGPRASKDPRIYGTTRMLLTALIKMMSLGNMKSRDSLGLGICVLPAKPDLQMERMKGKHGDSEGSQNQTIHSD